MYPQQRMENGTIYMPVPPSGHWDPHSKDIPALWLEDLNALSFASFPSSHQDPKVRPEMAHIQAKIERKPFFLDLFYVSTSFSLT